MKRKALALTLVLALLVSAIAGTQFVNLGKSDPFVPITAPVHPKITILSPEDHTLHTSNALTITFNVSINFEKGWSYINYVTYKASWQKDEITVYEHPRDDPYYPSEFSYKLNLTGIPDGKQTVMISAGGGGGHLEGEYYPDTPYLFDDAYNYTSVSFTIRSVSVLSPQNKTYDTSDVPLLFEVHVSSAKISYSLDGQDKVMVSGNTTLTDVPTGDHNVTFYVIDEAGNTGASETIYFSIQEPFPTTLVAAASGASVVIIGFGLLFYFKKRKR